LATAWEGPIRADRRLMVNGRPARGEHLAGRMWQSGCFRRVFVMIVGLIAILAIWVTL
jgi:hypothetical protein